jgi:hypothetical protein
MKIKRMNTRTKTNELFKIYGRRTNEKIEHIYTEYF